MANVMELLSVGVGSSVTLASFEFWPGFEASLSGPVLSAYWLQDALTLEPDSLILNQVSTIPQLYNSE